MIKDTLTKTPPELSPKNIRDQVKLGEMLYKLAVSTQCKIMGAKKGRTKGNSDYPSMSYLDTGGKRPTIVFVHGFGDDKYSFLKPALFLYRKFRIVVVDLPGFVGHSRDWNKCYTTPYLGNCLVSFMEELGLKDVHLIGNSLGGAVATYAALKRQRLLASLTLIDTAGFYYDHLDSFYDEYLSGKNMLQIKSEEDFRYLMSRIFHRPPYMPKPVVKYLCKRIADQYEWFDKVLDDLIGKNTDVNDKELVESLTFNNKISALEIPTLVMWGDKDSLFSVESAYRIKLSISNSELFIFKNSGHAPQYENPRVFASSFKKFVSKNIPV